MKRVPSCRLRVAGCGLQILAAGVAIFVSGFFYSALSQELRYKFKPGQVIQYEYQYEHHSQDTEGTTREIYEFRVDSLSGQGAHITMTIKQHSSKSAVYSFNNKKVRNERPEYYQSSIIDGYAKSYSELETPLLGDFNRSIHFIISANGQVSHISGLDAILNDVIPAIQENRWIKMNLSYDLLKLRYSEEYYKLLIRQFFPPLTMPIGKVQPDQTISMEHLNETIGFGFVWQGETSDSIPATYKFDHPIILHAVDTISSPDVEFTGRLNEATKGLCKWNSDKALFETINYNGVYMNELLFFWPAWMYQPGDYNDSVDVESSQMTIRLLKASDQNHVRINFQINAADSMVMKLYYPGDYLNQAEISVDINKYSSPFDICLPLENDGLVDILFFKPDEFMYNRSLSPNKIRIYAQSGDSMAIQISIDNLDEVQFSGCQAKENSILNKLLRLKNDNARISEYDLKNPTLHRIKEDHVLFNSLKSNLNPKFVERVDFELSYLAKEWELIRLRNTPPNQFKNGLTDTLEYYRKFLGQTQYPESTAYQGFLDNFVLACLKNAGIVSGSYHQEVFTSAAAFLQGWDRYWILAEMTNSAIKNNDSDREAYYRSFMAEYSETSFGRQLKDLYNSRKNANIKMKELLDIDELIGYPIIVSFDYKKSKKIIKNLVKNANQLLKSGLRYVQYIPENDYKTVLAELSSYTTTDSLNSHFVKPLPILPRVLSDSLAYYIEYLHRNPYDLILIDRDGEFVCWKSSEYYYGGLFDNLLSWPQLNPIAQKTINLKVLWYSLGGVIAFGLILFLILRIRAKRKEKRLVLKRKMAQLEVDAVRSRMNPHFLFNALSSIQNLVNRNQTEEANLYLARFGDLVRTILSQSSKPAIGLNEEIDMIRNYLQLEQLRFPFTFDIQIDPLLDLYAIEVPPLLIQPHVENAVMHGISGLGSDGRIEVRFRGENQQLVCEVTDNGPGYHPNENHNTNGLGQGWKLTRQRMQLLKEQLGEEVSVAVHDNKESSGTTVIFRLPMQKPDR